MTKTPKLQSGFRAHRSPGVDRESWVRVQLYGFRVRDLGFGTLGFRV